MPPKTSWDKRLKGLLKDELGAGWGIAEQSGRTKVTYRYADATRSSVMLDSEFSAVNATAIQNSVCDLARCMRENNLTLREAHKQLGAGVVGRKETAIDWEKATELFIKMKEDGGRRPSTLRTDQARMKQVLETAKTKPIPRDGTSFVRAYAAQHFEECPAGGEGRKKHLGTVCQLLDFICEHHGASDKWRPPSDQVKWDLIGVREDVGERNTRPLTDQQLEELLDVLEHDGRHELRLAVALVGLFGIRPAEMAAVRVEEGKLVVGGNVKRNTQTMRHRKEDRVVFPLNLPSKPGEGERLLALFDSGMLKLPEPILKKIKTAQKNFDYQKVGAAFGDQLKYYQPWLNLVAANPGLTPYSLRHSYAHRGHTSYAESFPVKVLASLMGHNPQTHHQHYGRWIDEEKLEDMVKRITSTPANKTEAVAS